MPASQELWEVLVPCDKPAWWPGKRRHFRTKHHQCWDAKVVKIAGGLTVLHPGRGQWVSPAGELFQDRMIPVRVACTREQLEEILDLTAKHYAQKAVFAYKVSDEVIVRHYHYG